MYYDPNEKERIKKNFELMESQNQIKQSVWDKINTPNVLQLEKEAHLLWEDHYTVDEKLQRKILLYNSRASRNNSNYISPGINIFGNIDPDLPDDIRELILSSRKTWEKYKTVDKVYTQALHKNIANLSLDVTLENSIKMNWYGSTRWVFSEFYDSCKPFLILDIGMREIIIIQDIFPDKYYHTEDSIVMSDLKRILDGHNYVIPSKNQSFYNSFMKELDKYRNNLNSIHSDYWHKKPVLNPLENIYTLYAQTDSEEYGRTRRYLIIGCVTYQR